MPEYANVERPFLDKLHELGWEIIDHKSGHIPQDPSISLRENFKEVTLKEVFKKSVARINTIDGAEWLTDHQLDHLHDVVTEAERRSPTLLDANRSVFERLIGQEKTKVSVNELTGDQDVQVHLVDFDTWENNSFIAINQFRLDTPGGPRAAIIPDITLFLNGLPICVIECKDVDVSDPLSEAFNQIQRYSNSRDDDFDIKEGEERLFHYNLFSIITHGQDARFASITGSFEHFLNWKDIFPEEYKVIDPRVYSAEEADRYGELLEIKDLGKWPNMRQEVVIHGMLNKEILIDILRHFTVFMETDEGNMIKVISRYQQYRAVGKMIDRIRDGEDPDSKSGVVWHTQGSGKSLTMVFFIRKLRSQSDLKDFKILMLVDRKDLETQLSDVARLTGEFKDKNIVSSRKALIPKLKNDASDLSMVMIHKFVQEEIQHSKALMKAFHEEGKIPEFKPFEVVNSSDRIIILIDEAHRTQGGDMGDNLFTAFPKAAKIAFTGTPLLTERHKQKTHERFGGNPEFIDTYKIRESVEDRATLDIVYLGKTSKDVIKDKPEFDEEFEDVFKHESPDRKKEIQKRYGTMRAYLENMDRLRKIAGNLVNHYIDEVLPNGYKAMVVASSVLAAARYEFLILEAIKLRLEEEKNKAERDEELIEQLEFIDASTVVTMQDNNEEAVISAVRKKAKERKAVDNFKKDFDLEKDDDGQYKHPNTGIAFLCVCDRLLTGFDAPIAQVMYLDKSLREHDLLQAIARVNRTKGTKQHGILVDYFGVSNHLHDALAIWGSETEEDIKDLLAHFRDIDDEIPVLQARYKRLVQHFEDKGVKEIQQLFEQKMSNSDEEFKVAEQCIELAADIAFRAQFDTYLKAFFDSLDLLFNTSAAKEFYIPAKRLGYLMMRIRDRYKDPSMDLKYAKAKVRKMIDKHLKSLGIDSKIPPVSLLSDKFSDHVDRHAKTSRSKASEMEHAIRRHIKVNLDKDPGLYTRFLKRMEDILERYKGNWEQMAAEFEQMRQEMLEGRSNEAEQKGLSEQELPFYDLLLMEVFEGRDVPGEVDEGIKELVKRMVDLLKDAINRPFFWKGRDSEIRKLHGELDDMLEFSSVSEISEAHDRLSVSVMNLAKRRHAELTMGE
jgi:type I restriction enzyme, R subunit